MAKKINDLCGADGHDFENDGGSIWGSSDEESNKASDLEREWQRRREQFHTIGYREGIIAGKEDAAQEGFNIGFKQSVLVGFNLGLARGVSSAVAFLPHELREKLIEDQETRNKFQKLHESIYALSTEDALSLFHDTTRTKQNQEQRDGTDPSPKSSNNNLESFSSELWSLLEESPAVKVNFETTCGL